MDVIDFPQKPARKRPETIRELLDRLAVVAEAGENLVGRIDGVEELTALNRESISLIVRVLDRAGLLEPMSENDASSALQQPPVE